jgi:hypothetical protein
MRIREKRSDARSISKMNMTDLSWFRLSRGVIAIRPVLLYYDMKFDAPDILGTAIFIVWRTTL